MRLPLIVVVIIGAWGWLHDGKAHEFGAYQIAVPFTDVFPGAERFGPVEGTPPTAAAYRAEQIVGYVFEAGDIGYSGKPIRILVGLDIRGIVVGARVIEHHEPILLVGIPAQKLFDFVGTYIGQAVVQTSAAPGKRDIISGATVTAIVVNDAVRRTALQVIRTRGLAGFTAEGNGEKRKRRLVDVPFIAADWTALVGEGVVRRLLLTQADVNTAFHRIGISDPELYAAAVSPESVFIDLHTALVTPESIGRNLLGNAEYKAVQASLKSGETVLLIAASGRYSFRGSGFVRGGIFDRIQVVQNATTVLFRDSHYRRIGSLAPGLPAFTEIGLFRIPESSGFDPAKPWRLELLVQRSIGPIEKAYTSFFLAYTIPDRYLKEALTAGSKTTPEEEAPIWQTIWRDRLGDVSILGAALLVLTALFFFQDTLVRYPRLIDLVRLSFLLFTLVWIGGYAQAQLSVINVLTFIKSLMSTFRWEFFLLDPLVFLLWSATAVGLLFWGRGVYCGWLCPFGALQELLNRLARWRGVRQYAVPFGLHERLWPVKYILFLGLFGVSLHSLALAERLAEVEPFKTVVLLRFDRSWPFVLYALALLGLGLLTERFFCRYLCPLGSALAIPARLRTFEWLKRRHQCGYECTICARQCGVQAIHPNGVINPNECFYCLKCQMNHCNTTVCPPLILRRTKSKRATAGQMGRESVATKESQGG